MSNLQLKLLLKYLKIKDSQVTMQKLWGGDIMALKNMVNELVEIGFENASRALKFAGFIPQSNKDGHEFEDAKEFIGGLYSLFMTFCFFRLFDLFYIFD